jgi:hypothetical protein
MSTGNVLPVTMPPVANTTTDTDLDAQYLDLTKKLADLVRQRRIPNLPATKLAILDTQIFSARRWITALEDQMCVSAGGESIPEEVSEPEVEEKKPTRTRKAAVAAKASTPARKPAAKSTRPKKSDIEDPMPPEPSWARGVGTPAVRVATTNSVRKPKAPTRRRAATPVPELTDEDEEETSDLDEDQLGLDEDDEEAYYRDLAFKLYLKEREAEAMAASAPKTARRTKRATESVEAEPPAVTAPAPIQTKPAVTPVEEEKANCVIA